MNIQRFHDIVSIIAARKEYHIDFRSFHFAGFSLLSEITSTWGRVVKSIPLEWHASNEAVRRVEPAKL